MWPVIDVAGVVAALDDAQPSRGPLGRLPLRAAKAGVSWPRSRAVERCPMRSSATDRACNCFPAVSGCGSRAMEDRSCEETPAAIAPELLGHPRSVFTPHLGSAVAEVRRDIEMRAAESILQALDGEQPGGAINSPSIETW